MVNEISIGDYFEITIGKYKDYRGILLEIDTSKGCPLLISFGSISDSFTYDEVNLLESPALPEIKDEDVPPMPRVKPPKGSQAEKYKKIIEQQKIDEGIVLLRETWRFCCKGHNEALGDEIAEYFRKFGISEFG